ncbi:MAG: hypothetical protein IK132_10345 [Clostridia bacterium]|nr:hypothetical protein [Clostridia bacterium]
MKKACCLILVLQMLLLAAVSCGERQPEQDAASSEEPLLSEEVSASAEEADTEITRENVPDSLPDNLDFAGKTCTIYYSNGRDRYKHIEGGEELSGEIVSDSVIACNESVAERLNVDLRYYPENSGNWDTITSLVSNLIMADDDTFDVYLGEQYGMTQTVVKGFYRNAFDLPYLDFDQPWWNAVFMDNLQLTSDNRMFLTGDFSLTTLSDLWIQYYNKGIYERLFGDPDEPYHLVLEGKWTIDKMSELIAASYLDLDGNGSISQEDQFGYVIYMKYSTVDPFMYCADIPYTSRDTDGRVVIDMNQERAVTLTEKTVGLFQQSAVFSESTAAFPVGKALFCGTQLGGTETFREMEDDFGFLPTPKLDEEQSAYRDLVADVCLLMTIPVTSRDADLAACVLEALNAETYRTVTPAWYEVTLKCKYSRDLLSSEIIDLIHDSIYTDFLFAYSPMISNIGQIMRTLVNNNNTNYASGVATILKPAVKQLERMYTALEKLGEP